MAVHFGGCFPSLQEPHITRARGPVRRRPPPPQHTMQCVLPVRVVTAPTCAPGAGVRRVGVGARRANLMRPPRATDTDGEGAAAAAATAAAATAAAAATTSTGGGGGESVREAMAAARACEQSGVSPGAGLKDAEAQAEAAFADMINTSIDVKVGPWYRLTPRFRS